MKEESRMKMEFGAGFVRPLEMHLGKLLAILKFTGILVTDDNKSSKQGQCLDLVQKLCYPIFIHTSLIFLWYGTWSHGSLNYATIIDTILPVLPCVMWFLMRKQTNSLRHFLAELSKITSENFLTVNRRLLYSTNAAICFIFLYPVLLLLMRVAQGNLINAHEVFRILQEAIFPLTMVVSYVSISYLLLQKLRYCKQKFHEKLDLSSSSDVENRIKDCMDVFKSVDMFENLFNSITFVLILHDFFMVLILAIDVLLMEHFVSLVLFEALCEILYAFVSLSIMSSFAGNLLIEMAAIKSVLIDKIFNQVDEEYPKINEKRVKLLLKRDICILTAGKIIVFNKAFMLKIFGFIFVVVIAMFGIYLIAKAVYENRI